MDSPHTDAGSPTVVNLEEYRNRVVSYVKENPASAIGILIAAIALLLAFLMPKAKEEAKPVRKVVRVHERIIERPVYMSRRDPRDEVKPKTKEEKTKEEKPKEETKEEKSNEEGKAS